jgi:hypothetical protein
MIKYNKKNNYHIITFEKMDSVITYKSYLKMIDTCKKWYSKEILKIEKFYNQMVSKKKIAKSLEITHKHKLIVVKLIKKMLTYYPIVKTFDFGLFISNSFARGTNLIDSDYDLNFVYEDDHKDIGLLIEEQISYALSIVVNKYRDFIHDSITHRMKLTPEDIVYNDTDDVLFVGKWANKSVKYNITKGNEKLMLNYCFGKRNINSYIKYMLFYSNELEINEWLYFQTVIYGNEYVNRIFIELKEKVIAINNLPSSHQNLATIIDNVKSTIKDELSTIDNIDYNNMQNFKKHFKNMAYNKIFTFIAILKNVDISNNIDFEFNDLYDYLSNKNIPDKNILYNYFGNIMLFNYICNQYGIEFRIRYSNIIPNEFNTFFQKYVNTDLYFIEYYKSLLIELYAKLLCMLSSINLDLVEEKNYIYNVGNEYINISNYSPFSHINEVSIEYQKRSFMLPFIKLNGIDTPIHPDTFNDLNLDNRDVIKRVLVYPTSSYRTVYDGFDNKCYKLPLLRKITRSIRNLPNKELDRSILAQKLLDQYHFPNFTYLREECFYNEDEIYNFIIREMPKVETYPWFYEISSQKFSKEFQLKCITNIIKSWMFYASRGIYFESPHTQNYLVDLECNIYYRDLSDIRNLEYEIMKPSFYNDLSSKGEMLSVFFDRAMCNQNLDHLFNYCKEMNNDDFNNIRSLIKNEIEKYKLPFPEYSMDYSKSKKGHVPEKIDKVKWR